jgi:hypothetical protein
MNFLNDVLTSRTGSCDRICADKVQRPKVPNLSMYSEWRYDSMVEISMKLLYDTEGTTIVSRRKIYERLHRNLVVVAPNETTVKEMVSLANYLVHFEYRHQAFFFYFAAIQFCDQLCLGPCRMEHDSLLQIAKLINAGKLRLDSCTTVDDNLYPAILKYLMHAYESREASFLF